MTSNQKKTLDKLWQINITQEPCLICGDPQSIGHHLIKRRFLNTRWDLNNGVALCNQHHQDAHQTNDDAILDIIGEEEYQRLYKLAQTVKHHNYTKIKVALGETCQIG